MAELGVQTWPSPELPGSGQQSSGSLCHGMDTLGPSLIAWGNPIPLQLQLQAPSSHAGPLGIGLLTIQPASCLRGQTPGQGKYPSLSGLLLPVSVLTDTPSCVASSPQPWECLRTPPIGSEAALSRYLQVQGLLTFLLFLPGCSRPRRGGRTKGECFPSPHQATGKRTEQNSLSWQTPLGERLACCARAQTSGPSRVNPVSSLSPFPTVSSWWVWLSVLL